MLKQKKKVKCLNTYHIKQFKRVIEKLKAAIVLVEGKRDVEAIHSALGIEAIATAYRPREMIYLLKEIMNGEEKSKEVVILTDLDRRGNELAKILEQELSPFFVCDIKAREIIGYVLKLRAFEDFDKQYRKFLIEYADVWRC